jgi:hypothetical protein
MKTELKLHLSMDVELQRTGTRWEGNSFVKNETD